ncbi:hypothetical protein FHS85_002837 [Rhodoligotrophos appendicifer]|uniref:MBL fold metallo-hydrolase n=1 Tax=Rhodoligotrophos appendicifer TaxID=987056 RepID=UPI0011860F87|nr:MBL fold metallo-hydrolase [Rhodoligotrophos appendicifer]
MAAFLCTACGMQFEPTPAPPPSCPICEEERQFVPETGQGWITMAELRRRHINAFRQYEPGLLGIGTVPHFAIGQRALLLVTDVGNILWDCISLVDDATISVIRAMGGLAAIAVSHPHYYSSIIEWSRAFGDVPIFLHEADRRWVMRPDPAIEFWAGEHLLLADGITLIRCGGHFAGGTVLHWEEAAAGRGALLSGDVIQVVADNRHVSFMRSFPNYIPLSEAAVRRIEAAVNPFPFDKIYGAFWDRLIETDGKSALQRSAERYVLSITGHGAADDEQ